MDLHSQTLPDDHLVDKEGTDRAGGGDGVDDPIMTLRGAGVATDVHRVGRTVGGLCLVALAGVVIVLFVAGFEKNAQITRLHQQGVPVVVTSTGCTGLLGGSGSNSVGYACRGSFTVGGHRDDEAIPGNTLYPPGTTLRAVTVPDDPALLTPTRQAAGEHPSGTVFVVPAVLLLLLTALVGVVLRRRHLRRA